MNLIELIGPAIATVVGLLILWWGIACRTGRFSRNPILGYRTPAALRSASAWDAAHRGYAPWIILAGVTLTVAGITALLGTLAGADDLLPPVLGVGAAVLLLAMIVGGVFAHRALVSDLRENGNHDD